MSELGVFLVVDDNPDDTLLLGRVFRRANMLNPLQAVGSGAEAIAYLKGEGRYANREEFPLPALILLDLKMPGMDGFEVLQWMRGQPELQRLRVVILTGSDDMRDVNRAYELGANSFLIKPTDFDRFVEISLALNGYWMWLDREPQVQRRRGAEAPKG